MGRFLEVLAHGKYSRRKPRAVGAPKSPRDQKPRPRCGAPRALQSRLGDAMRAAEQPDVRSIQRRASVLQLNDVIDEHAPLGPPTALGLAPSIGLTSNSVAQRDPFRRGVERLGDLGRQRRGAQIRQSDTQLLGFGFASALSARGRSRCSERMRFGRNCQSASNFDPRSARNIDPSVLWDLAVGARAVKADRGCGDGANAVHGLIEVSALESPTVVARLDDVTVMNEAIE